MPKSIRNLAGLPAAEMAALEAALMRLGTLEDVLMWGRAQRPPLLVNDIVTQDEYTHDVIAHWRGSTVVFDAT